MLKASFGVAMLSVKSYYNESCAANGISNLGECSNAVDAMKQFCAIQLGVKDVYASTFSKLACFYTFVAGPEVPKDAPGGSHHSKKWVKYGTEFAQFIIDNGLGSVVTVGPKPNLKHHPTSTAQMWLWNPDQKALETWWSECYTTKEKNNGNE